MLTFASKPAVQSALGLPSSLSPSACVTSSLKPLITTNATSETCAGSMALEFDGSEFKCCFSCCPWGPETFALPITMAALSFLIRPTWRMATASW